LINCGAQSVANANGEFVAIIIVKGQVSTVLTLAV
jgi:hypothetical protein